MEVEPAAAEPACVLSVLAVELLEPCAEVSDAVLPVDEDWLVCAPCVRVDDELVSVDVWLAVVLLDTDWSPLEFTLTPGLMLAEALTSVLLMPTLASTPTLGFTSTLVSVDVPEDWPNTEPNAPATAAAVIVTARFLNLIMSPFRDSSSPWSRKGCATRSWGIHPRGRGENARRRDYSASKKPITSAARSRGRSSAAKCPPFCITLQRRMSV